MPRQNRVTPFGEIIATPARGTLMGNRGCLHDASGRIVRQTRLNAWIYCVLEFKGRRRAVMQPGRYTELFFLDEATALAAGGAYNAITMFEDYKQPPTEEQPEQRLDRAWFGGGADIKLKALVKAIDLATAWQ